MLGDCLLHRDHHQMESRCWAVVLQFHVEHTDRPGWTVLQAYKDAYERACLEDVLESTT